MNINKVEVGKTYNVVEWSAKPLGKWSAKPLGKYEILHVREGGEVLGFLPEKKKAIEDIRSAAQGNTDEIAMLAEGENLVYGFETISLHNGRKIEYKFTPVTEGGRRKTRRRRRTVRRRKSLRRK
jgi:hypothetical protein